MNWCNPPFSLLLRLIQLLASQPAVAATVVAPYWPAQPWFPELIAIAAEVVTLEPCHDMFLPGIMGSTPALGPPKWPILVCRIIPGLEPLRASSDLSSLELRAPRHPFPIPQLG